MVYCTTPEWQLLQPLISVCFLKKPGLYHYLSMAKSNYREYLRGDIVRPKKYFYVLRPILACKWILEKSTPPPMAFCTLTEEYLPAELTPEVNRLLDLKKRTSEIADGPRIDALNEFINRSLIEMEEAILHLPHEEPADWGALNQTFYDILNSD